MQLASNHDSIERRGSKDDSQAGENKLVELLANKYNVKGLPTTLLITYHIKKREFNKRIASLIDREAIRVETSTVANGNVRKAYALSPLIMDSWKK